jgi:MFS family permease
MGQTVLSAFLPLYLSLHLNVSPGAAGAYMSLLFFFAGVGPALVGWISDRFRPQKPDRCVLGLETTGVVLPLDTTLLMGVPLFSPKKLSCNSQSKMMIWSLLDIHARSF